MLPSELEIVKQEIVLAPDQVKTSYSIDNTSNQDILQTLVIAQGGNLTANDQPIECKLIHRAISQNGQDISTLLKTHGLPFDPILAMHSIDASANRDLIRKKLISLDLLSKDDETPRWIARSFCYWNQHFPADQQIIIKQNFKPMLATKNFKVKNSGGIFSMPVNVLKSMYNLAVHWRLEDQITANQLQEQLVEANPELKDYCPTLKDFQALINEEDSSNTNRKTIEAKTLTFDFAADNFATTPIKNLILKINSPESMHPMLCWKGNLKTSAKNTNSLVFETEDFIPLQNINILFVEK